MLVLEWSTANHVMIILSLYIMMIILSLCIRMIILSLCIRIPLVVYYLYIELDSIVKYMH
jgi:hypothetical protein